MTPLQNCCWKRVSDLNFHTILTKRRGQRAMVQSPPTKYAPGRGHIRFVLCACLFCVMFIVFVFLKVIAVQFLISNIFFFFLVKLLFLYAERIDFFHRFFSLHVFLSWYSRSSLPGRWLVQALLKKKAFLFIIDECKISLLRIRKKGTRNKD